MGLINAAPYIGSAFLGCWASDPLNNFWGRRGTIFVSGNFCLWSVVGSAFSQTWEQLLVCRLLLGVGMGAKASTVPIYAAENSPAAIRGACKNIFVTIIPSARPAFNLSRCFLLSTYPGYVEFVAKC